MPYEQENVWSRSVKEHRISLLLAGIWLLAASAQVLAVVPDEAIQTGSASADIRLRLRPEPANEYRHEYRHRKVNATSLL